MDSLVGKLLKVAGDSASVLDSDSGSELIPVPIKALNVILSGELDGGFPTGLNIFAGPSSSFKTMFSLILVKSYLKKYPDAVCVFYDSEGGISDEYWDAVGIPKDKVVRLDAENIVWMKNSILKMVKTLSDNDAKAIFLWDSIGNTPSLKEYNDSLDGKENTDMGTRAKELRAFFRAVGNALKKHGLPMIAANHIYESTDMYGKRKMGGGHGPMFMAQNVLFVSKSDMKEGGEKVGHVFTLKVEKSRFVKDNAKLAIELSFGGKLGKYTGMFDVALEAGAIEMSGRGWYSAKLVSEDGEIVFETTNSIRKSDFDDDFWDNFLKYKEFHKLVRETYKLDSGSLLDDDVVEEVNDAG